MFLLFLHAKKLLIRHGQAAGQAEYMPGDYSGLLFG